MLLQFMHRILGAPCSGVQAGFHLNKNQGIAVNRHDVDFGAGGAEIGLHDPVTLAPQPPDRQPLSLVAERTPTAAGVPVQNAFDPPKSR